MQLQDLPAHFDAQNNGRSAALARTLREYQQFFGDASQEAIATGFRLAGAITGEGPVAFRAATCREIADLLGELPEDREGAKKAWQGLIDGFTKARDSAPPDAQPRYNSVIVTLQRELATF